MPRKMGIMPNMMVRDGYCDDGTGWNREGDLSDRSGALTRIVCTTHLDLFLLTYPSTPL